MQVGTVVGALLVISSFFCLNAQQKITHHSSSQKRHCRQKKLHNPMSDGIGKTFLAGTADLLKDFGEINVNLFSMSSIKTLVAFTPPYLIARMADKRVHKQFYDDKQHKNKRQMPQTVTKVVNRMGDVGIIALTSLSIFGWNERLRLTGRIFGLGAASALLFKDLIKQVECSVNIRPYNEHFPKKKCMGGFPSGHMIEASYMATVWGLQYGWRAGVPLGLFALVELGVLVNCNRHYASQVVAGAGVGVMFGIAANKLIDKRLQERCLVDVGMDTKGFTNLKLALCF